VVCRRPSRVEPEEVVSGRRYRRVARAMNAVTSASSGSTLRLPHQGQLTMGAAGVTLTWASSHVDPPSAPARDSAQSQFIPITSESMIGGGREGVKCVVCIAAMLAANACETDCQLADGVA
jgi:hypothetical protein